MYYQWKKEKVRIGLIMIGSTIIRFGMMKLPILLLYQEDIKMRLSTLIMSQGN